MRVLFLDVVHGILASRLTAAGFECIPAENESKDRCLKLVEQVDGVVVRSRFPMDESFLKGANRLKFIARSGAGMENIDVPYCESKGITLFNAPEGNRNAVGEHALGMLLALLNKLHTADRSVRKGKWDREGNRGMELDGRTVGIIGYGNNGAAFAKKMRGFEVTILAYDKYKSDFGDDYVRESSMDEIFEKADVISFHIPQNEETLFMANADFFSKFQNSFFLLNLSRGKIIDTTALVKAMRSGSILGAGLDVLEYEKASFETFMEHQTPQALQYLLDSEQVILSPHVAGWTRESYFKLSAILADKIISKFKKSIEPLS
jgi:D-3-phosphoglycerate dehydrogenase / 2-oxoglutarate reductase